MRIFIVGDALNLEEARLKFGADVPIAFVETEKDFQPDDFIFDFTIHDSPERVVKYKHTEATVFLNAAFISLRSLGVTGGLFGFCGLHTLFNRPLLEVSYVNTDDKAKLTAAMSRLGTAYGIVADQAGLVAPRIIARIINEAYSAFEDGTAGKSDIDLAMKLGTNYPYGPFEWCERLGRTQVIRLLEAAWKESRDERYRPVLSLRAET